MPAETTTTYKVLGVLPYSAPLRYLVYAVSFLAMCYVVGLAAKEAFRIRTYALTEYGKVIHEFDPWFNFRATQYLSKHGWHAFFHWFDYMVWYPLGRPVGTTIYPGLQITSVAIHRTLKWLGPGWQMSLNDICCYVPCWFGGVATVFLALLTYEVSGSTVAGAISAIIFAIIPAHMMRSVGGGYDNESIAMTAMLMTFYFWILSLRNSKSWPVGVITGLAYGYMVAAWGGFIFVLNIIAIHAAVLAATDMIVFGRWNETLFRAYSLFFVVGTSIAVCVPPVGWMPFKSFEQLGAFVVFIALVTLKISEAERVKGGHAVHSVKGVAIRIKYAMMLFGVLALVAAVLWPTGYFGPLGSRIRGLFVKHTRTGNPLVDSVAEHQPATEDAYRHYLHHAINGWYAGVFFVPVFCYKRWGASTFLTLYALVAYYFANRMARLVLLSGPVASSMSSIILGMGIEWCIGQVVFRTKSKATEEEDAASPKEEVPAADSTKAKDDAAAAAAKKASGDSKKAAGGKKAGGEESPKPQSVKSTGKKDASKATTDDEQSIVALFNKTRDTVESIWDRLAFFRLVVAAFALYQLYEHYPKYWKDFNAHSEQMAHSFANPQIMFKTRLNNGRTVIIDDYREAYFWLKKNTPEDSRVMAWWDYGYQITGIANRTSIADGNTWNHEHIATLGKCLTSPVKEAHSLIRHLADYVLIWAGGGGDDLAKSPHMARIGNSIYRDICPKSDPLCSHFGFYDNSHDKPTPSMRKSLLYNMHAHNMKSGVHLDSKLFTEAYSSKYGLVRIFKVMNVSQESKAWVADPANRDCDAPGSWYCVGRYPPAPEIQSLIKRRIPFGQLEDFNKGNVDKEYHEAYMRRMGGH